MTKKKNLDPYKIKIDANCSCEKHLIGKLVLACGMEISNKTDTLLDDKK